jgi:hypothetical protein
LLRICQSLAANLKPGGRFVSINNNPQVTASYALLEKYGVSASYDAPLQEGTSIFLTLTIPGSDEKISFNNTSNCNLTGQKLKLSGQNSHMV